MIRLEGKIWPRQNTVNMKAAMGMDVVGTGASNTDYFIIVLMLFRISFIWAFVV